MVKFVFNVQRKEETMETSVPMAFPRSRTAPYFFVVLGVGSVLAVCDLLIRVSGNQRGLAALFWVTIFASGLLWGRWPAMLAAVLSSLSIALHIFPSTDVVGTTVVAMSMVGAAYLTGFAHTAKTNLPALRTRGFWDFAPSGDYAEDCATGEQEAEAFLRRLSWEQKLYALGWLVRDMIAGGRFTGVEAGFFHRISLACLNSSEINLRLVAEHNPQHINLQPGVVDPDGEVRPPPISH
jgi:hypothetical protein